MREKGDEGISDYGLIGNCRTAALVSRQGSIDWCCFPRFDSPSYFARLLDPKGGHFRISPVEPFESNQLYLDATNVLQTTFVTASGHATLTDFFSVRGNEAEQKDLWPDEEILRIVEGISGEVELAIDFVPRAPYGRSGIRLHWIGHWGIQCNHGKKILLLQTSLPKDAIQLKETELGLTATARFSIRKGDRVAVSLSYSDVAPAVLPSIQLAEDRLATTMEYWKRWSDRCRYEGPRRDLVVRSALALKLLNFAPSGAFIAAPTTSLPENEGGSRNWDYRYCWLRDASFTTRALMSLGYIEEAKAFLNWLLHSTRLSWPRLQVLYSVYGESRVSEEEADWLGGFGGAKPVRIGNAASTQLQLDVYGEVIDSFFSLSEYLGPIDRETQQMVVGFGRAVAELWDQPDQSIWEFRSRPRHYTHSKLMCWVSMDRLSRLSQRLRWRLPYDAGKIAEEIRASIEAQAYDSWIGSYTRAYGESVLDASLLVMPLVGYCDPRSPRFVSTREAIIRRLSKEDLVYRYPPGDDDLVEPEGAFTLCNFWLAEALALAGQDADARRFFEAVTRRLPPQGLASEEIEPGTRTLLGNYPQGFSHVGLINAALALSGVAPEIRRATG